MKTYDVAEVKSRFSTLVSQAEACATIVICGRNIPAARLTPSTRTPNHFHISFHRHAAIFGHGQKDEP
jgi:antitoxin (DNA-binding transcriptional repressor) of toxin-antitoxin stability system